MGVWGRRQTLNRLKINEMFLKKKYLDNVDTTFSSRTIDSTGWLCSSVLPKIAESNWVTQFQQTCASRGWYPDNEHINKYSCSGVSHIRTFYEGSNIARSIGVRFHTFSIIYTQLERDILVYENYYPGQGWKSISIFFRKLNVVVHDIIKPYTKFQI